MKQDLETLAGALLGGARLCSDTLSLALGECTLQLRSNSAALIAGLRRYFSHVPEVTAPPDMQLIAIEREAPETGIEFLDWQREPGKSGRKDAYFDLPGGRLIRKVRTGMVFLQSATQRIAAGPCLEYDNQVINFINAQYMNWLQHRGWQICHSAGLVYRGKCFGIAGFSGGGKSTLMLQLLEHDAVSYLTNDRLFVRREAGHVRARGIPKLPRINPGTIVHNARLQGLIPAPRRAALLAMPPGQLWQLEDKYDVCIDAAYGPGRIVPEAPLGGYLVLNWSRDSDAPLTVAPVRLAQRRELLAAIMKSPGPFYQYPDGGFYRDDAPFDTQAYLDALQGVGIFEVSGGIDFAALADRCLNELLG